MATITKLELTIRITEILAKKGTNFSQQQVSGIVQTLIEEITNFLSQGETVVMRNFGSFEVRELRPKVGRNPKVPEKDIAIPARAVVKFKAGKELKEKVRQLRPSIPADGRRQPTAP